MDQHHFPVLLTRTLSIISLMFKCLISNLLSIRKAPQQFKILEKRSSETKSVKDL